MSNIVPNNIFILYATPKGEVQLNVFLKDDSIWLIQKSIAILFGTTPQNFTIHLKNIFESDELEEVSTCTEYLQVQLEGEREVSRNQKMYNLDVIISVGYYQYFKIEATKNSNALREVA